ncbi:MAG: hypothetical protein KatS3mg045_0215 [Bellilinea sp.]|nr:MAG: hypothetical protein KatS3mg045_0215 [Bellilinea sp.]
MSCEGSIISSLKLDMTLNRACHCEPPQAAWQSPAWPLHGRWGRFLASLGMTLRGACHCEPPQAAWQKRVYVIASRRKAARQSPARQKRVYVIASRRKAAWQSPARPLQGRWGRFLASLGMTLRGACHCEPPQAARQSPAETLWRQGGRPLASLGMTLRGACHCEPPQAAWQSPPTQPSLKSCTISGEEQVVLKNISS